MRVFVRVKQVRLCDCASGNAPWAGCVCCCTCAGEVTWKVDIRAPSALSSVIHASNLVIWGQDSESEAGDDEDEGAGAHRHHHGSKGRGVKKVIQHSILH